MSALEIRNVRKTFGDTEVLKEISLAIDSGEFLILVGPSGCGKSTLMNAIAGLEPVTAGEIHIGGEDVTWRTPAERDIAMVFQSYALYPSMTVRQNIAFGLEMRKVPKAERDQAVERVADLLQISQLLDRKPSQLSGGQRQRVGLARALYGDPVLVVLDEPNSNLDDSGERALGDAIAQLKAEGVTLFVISHRQSVLKHVDKLLVLKEGQVSMFGPRDQVLAQFAKPGKGRVANTRSNGRLAAVQGGQGQGNDAQSREQD